MVRETPRCRICNEKTNVRLYYANVISWDIEGSYNYYKCLKCGTIFLHPLPDKKKIYRLYSSLSYWGISEIQKSEKYWIGRADREYGYILKNIDIFNKVNILDYGCGSGLLLFRLKK